MAFAAEERRSSLAGVVATLGGLVLAASALLPWARSAEVPAELDAVSSRGYQDVGGVMVLAFGLLAAIAGVVLLARVSPRGRRAATLVAIVIGAAAVTVGVLQIRGIEDTTVARLALEYSNATGEPVAPIEQSLKAALDIRPAYGLFVAVGGGALVLVGGLLGLRGSRSAPVTPVPPAIERHAPPPSWQGND